ncbi:MAG: GNAT family N-acetyltransferase [Acidobacteria bacterium]|nr:GNAT family N-acetyltransferase [Acidobacteriota bacterium]
MRPITPSLPASDDPALRSVLRDGSVVTLKIAEPADHDAVRRFFHDLSAESRRRRFFGIAEPPDALITRWCDSSDPTRALTLLAMRLVDEALRPIAIGSYIAVGGASAEVAFAVDDRFQGKGLGTILLEHLATIAAANGFRRFEATTLPENAAMLDVFHESGFEIRSKSDSGTIAVQLSLSLRNETIASAERRMALATAASLRPLLEPAAVAVVGASRDRSSIGRRVLHALVTGGFRGGIYPVNPSASELEGLRCYASVADAPSGIDLAVIVVPRATVLEVVDQCAAAGVKSLVVITAGFAEAGDDGRALQAELVDRVRAYGIRMIGPNCMGVLNANAGVKLNASFSPIVPPSGRVALSSQSGALGMAILELATERRVGLSTFVSVGNKADVSGNDLLQYWEADPHTAVILLYLESFGNPRRFARLARRIGRKKPIVCVKAGRTRAGSRAAGSHTAALAASDAAVDALFHQSGVIRADTIDDMFDVAACLEAQPLPRAKRVAIVTNAGGPGILAVDACEAAGLNVPAFSPDTRTRLAEFLPPEASSGNPVDMVASAGPGEYRRAIEVALTSDDADALIVIYTPVDTSRTEPTLQAIRDGIAAGRHAGATGKPIVACLMAGPGRPQPLEIAGECVPAYAFPENAARALAKIAAYADWRAQTPGLLWSFEDIRADDARAVCQRAQTAKDEGWLTADDTRAVLGAFGLPMAAGTIARSPDEAAALAQVIGFPVAAKLAARRIPHKTDVGGVRLNLTSDTSVRRAFTDIMTLGRKLPTGDEIEGVLIQSMIAGGVETVIGVSDDPLFGPLVAFGLGGIHVEILGDVRFRIAPLTDRDADELLHGIRGLPLLQGYRGHPPADLDALRELLLRVSRLAVEVPEIVELDLNPVIALPPGHGCRIVDARVKVRQRS